MTLRGYGMLVGSESRTAGTSLAGRGPRKEFGLALCDAGKDGCYLFTCDSEWRVMWDSSIESPEYGRTMIDKAYPESAKEFVWLKK